MKKIVSVLLMMLFVTLPVDFIDGEQPPIFETIDTTAPSEPERPMKHKLYSNIPLDEEIQKIIWDECQKYDVSFELMLAIAKVESDFKLNAKSSAGAVGLFQLHQNVVQVVSRGTGIRNFDRNNLQHNIEGAVYEVSRLNEYWSEKGYGQEDVFGLTLLSYNRGITGAEKLIKNNYNAIYKDNYVQKIESYKSKLEMGMIE